MAKSKNKKKTLSNQRKNKFNPNSTPSTIENTTRNKSLCQKLKSFSKKTYAILGVISLLIGYILYYDTFSDMFKSKHEKFEEDNFIPGIFIPPQILTSYDTVLIEVGGICEAVPIKSLQQGHYIKPNSIQCKGTKETPFDLILYLENSRLYMHCVLKDIQKEEIVGIINFKHWSLFKPNLLNYSPSDTSLEVLDKRGNVIFDLCYKLPNKIKLKGYFVGKGCIYVITDEGITIFMDESKERIIQAIGKIKSSNFKNRTITK